MTTVFGMTVTTGATTPTPHNDDIDDDYAPTRRTSWPPVTVFSVTFTASQVLVDGTASAVASDRVTGIVSARSGNTLGIEDATLIQNNGTNTFAPGTTIVNVGPNTLITFFGEGAVESISPQEISVGSAIEAFGIVSSSSTGQTVLDASAGHVRLDLTTASGSVTAQGSGSLTLNLTSLGGRTIRALDFNGSGAAADQFSVATGSLDLTNATVGAPSSSVDSGPFGTAAPTFTATALLDHDHPGGTRHRLGRSTAAPFTSFDSSSIVLNIANGNIGARHLINSGRKPPTWWDCRPIHDYPSSATATVFSIGHASSSSVESFNTYDAFITQLLSELNGTNLATGMTAIGQYTASTLAFSASSITLFLND